MVVTALPATLTRRPVVLAGPTALLGAAALVALGLALRLPVATAVLGLAVFGILHNVLELRYVAGRFDGILSGQFLFLCVVLITGVAICRLLPVSAGSRGAEILLCYGLLLIACRRAWRHRPVMLAGAGLAVGFAALVSLSFPAYHFVVLTHLHNIVPLVFLWEWSNGLGRGRLAFRATNLLWVLVLPALLVAGLFDRWLRASSAALAGFGGGAGFTAERLSVAYTPTAWLDTQLAVRFLAVFAFMQTMHYVVWVLLFPRYAADAATRFDARVPGLAGRRAWLLGLAGALAFGLLFAYDYAAGRALYASVASYHAYLEFPVLLALILRFQPEGERP